MAFFFFGHMACGILGPWPGYKTASPAVDSKVLTATVSVTVFSMNIQGGFPLWLTGLISLQSKGFSRVFSSIHNLKALIIQCFPFFTVQISYLYMTLIQQNYFKLNC